MTDPKPSTNENPERPIPVDAFTLRYVASMLRQAFETYTHHDDPVRASECWSLVRHLSELLGDGIPEPEPKSQAKRLDVQRSHRHHHGCFCCGRPFLCACETPNRIQGRCESCLDHAKACWTPATLPRKTN